MSKIRKLRRQLFLLVRAQVLAASRRVAPIVGENLDALAVLYGTDKAVGRHGYTPFYARHLDQRRPAVRNVLEIGIGGTPYEDPFSGGNSLRMWRSYFPTATIYGLDLYEKRLDGEPRIVTLRGDQSKPESLREIATKCPRFDLIIDDGSHVGAHINTTFTELFPYLQPGGVYVIEDLFTSYSPGFGGGPPGTPGTAVELVKGLVDDVNVRPKEIAAVHVHPGIVFIEKAP